MRCISDDTYVLFSQIYFTLIKSASSRMTVEHTENNIKLYHNLGSLLKCLNLPDGLFGSSVGFTLNPKAFFILTDFYPISAGLKKKLIQIYASISVQTINPNSPKQCHKSVNSET